MPRHFGEVWNERGAQRARWQQNREERSLACRHYDLIAADVQEVDVPIAERVSGRGRRRVNLEWA